MESLKEAPLTERVLGWVRTRLRDGGDVDSGVTVISSSLEGRANSVFIFLSVANVTHS